jgi:hypothetical protein
MKKNIFVGLLPIVLLSLVSCQDWLTDDTPGTTKLNDYFSSSAAAVKCVNAAYAPLGWEYNTTYFSEWFIGDVASDDALKGGQNIGDMADAYDIENFKTTANNTLLLDYFRAQYQGISRCNLALTEIPAMSSDSISDAMRSRLIGEAEYLRAFYYFRLVRIYGGVPIVDFVVDSSDKWNQPRATSDAVYEFIVKDLADAQSRLPLKIGYSSTDLGRATKGAAQAMLLKTYLYMKDYAHAKQWGDSIINSGQYSLCSNYHDNFTLAGENGVESVFEIQYMDDATSDYGEGDGFTRGSFTQVLTRSRSSQLGSGWGFNKPTQNLYDEFEPGDIRRDETIINPTDEQIETPAQEIYLGDRYLNKKYAWINDDGTFPRLSHATRGPLNNKVIRYSDVLLMYAEACCELNNLDRAQWALEQVRSRARSNGESTALPKFPYTTTIQGATVTYTNTQADLRKAIRHERRVELAMEGGRWFDLCRWGVAKEVMEAYKAGETNEVKTNMATFVEGKNELFPIPSKEIELEGIEQNPGY